MHWVEHLFPPDATSAAEHKEDHSSVRPPVEMFSACFDLAMHDSNAVHVVVVVVVAAVVCCYDDNVYFLLYIHHLR